MSLRKTHGIMLLPSAGSKSGSLSHRRPAKTSVRGWPKWISSSTTGPAPTTRDTKWVECGSCMAGWQVPDYAEEGVG
jgi:hypothetical protein